MAIFQRSTPFPRPIILGPSSRYRGCFCIKESSSSPLSAKRNNGNLGTLLMVQKSGDQQSPVEVGSVVPSFTKVFYMNLRWLAAGFQPSKGRMGSQISTASIGNPAMEANLSAMQNGELKEFGGVVRCIGGWTSCLQHDQWKKNSWLGGMKYYPGIQGL